MDIREIRLDHFGCWEGVKIRSLAPGLNVIHLDHDGRPIDFSRFLYGVLFGFEEKRGRIHAGRIDFSDGEQQWTLDRHAGRDGRQSWNVKVDGREPNDQLHALKQLQTSSDDAVERLFLPTEFDSTDPASISDRWHWLARNPQVLGDLLRPRTARSDNSFLRQSCNLSLAPHGTVVERLGKEREELVAAIAHCRANLVEERKAAPRTSAIDRHDPVRPNEETIIPINQTLPLQHVSVPSETNVAYDDAQRNLLADLKDELRTVKLQLSPMRTAVDLSERWEELRTLKKRLGHAVDESEPTVDSDKLRSLLSSFKTLEEEKRDYRKSLGNKSRPAKRQKTSDEHRVRRLLDQRDWVTEAIDKSFAPLEIAGEHHSEIRHAGQLFETARKEAERADRRMYDFGRRTNFDWSTLSSEYAAPLTREIAIDSPIAQEPPTRQLSELKRRRLWVREEHRSLIDRQVFLPQMLIWLAILFALSVASLFGTLIVTSSVAQWVLLAFGIGGIVSSFSLKMSIELRSSRLLNRAKDRLRQIDAEILSLTEQVLDQNQDAAANRRRAEERLYALQMQQDAAEANRRLDSAERSFRELLDVHGMPASLSPTEAYRALQRRERSIESEPKTAHGNAKLRTWIKRARNTIQRIDGVRPGKDPHALLANLESLFDHLRDQVHTSSTSSNKSSSYNRELRDDARKQIRRIEKRQQSILRKAKVDDQFGLESMAESADDRSRSQQRIRRLEAELKTSINMHDDPDEVRELLEAYDAASLRTVLADRKSRKTQVEQELLQLESQPRSNATPVAPVPHRVERIEHVPTEPIEPVFDPRPTTLSHHQTELDRLRIQLSVVETQIRRAMKSAQTAAILRTTARTLLQEKQAPAATFPFLAELSEGRWDTLKVSADGIVASGPAGDDVIVESSSDESLVWLAVQLAAANNLRSSSAGSPPVCLLADSLLNSTSADRIYSVLRRAGEHGVQCLLLAGDRQLVNQLGEAGASIVRVALREDSSLRIAEVADDQPDMFERRIVN